MLTHCYNRCMPVIPIWDLQAKMRSLSLHLLLLLTETSKGRQGALHRAVQGAGSRGENATLCGCISSVASSSTGRERQGKHWYLNCKSACKSISSQVFSATCSSSSLKPDGMEEAQLPCWVCLLAKGQLALSFCPSRHIH